MWKKGPKNKDKALKKLTEKEIRQQLYGYLQQEDLFIEKGPAGEQAPLREEPPTLTKVPREAAIFKYEASSDALKKFLAGILLLVLLLVVPALVLYFSKALLSRATVDEPLPSVKEIVEKKPYTIQVAIYQNEADAKKIVDYLKKKGYNSFIYKSISSKGKNHYRIYVGEFIAASDAKYTLRKLRDKEKFNDAFVRFR